MANRKPTGFDSAVVTSFGHSLEQIAQLITLQITKERCLVNYIPPLLVYSSHLSLNYHLYADDTREQTIIGLESDRG